MSARPRGGEGLTLLVGVGRMGGALLKGWIGQGIGPIAVIETNANKNLAASALANGIRLFKTIDDASHLPVSACVIALKPQVLRSEAVRLRLFASSGALMVSIAAGTGIPSLRKAWLLTF